MLCFRKGSNRTNWPQVSCTPPLPGSCPLPPHTVFDLILSEVLVFDPKSSAGGLSETGRVVEGSPEVVVVVMDLGAHVTRKANGCPGRFRAEVVLGVAVEVARDLVLLPGLVGQSDHTTVREEPVGEVSH